MIFQTRFGVGSKVKYRMLEGTRVRTFRIGQIRVQTLPNSSSILIEYRSVSDRAGYGTWIAERYIIDRCTDHTFNKENKTKCPQ